MYYEPEIDNSQWLRNAKQSKLLGRHMNVQLGIELTEMKKRCNDIRRCWKLVLEMKVKEDFPILLRKKSSVHYEVFNSELIILTTVLIEVTTRTTVVYKGGNYAKYNNI